MPISELHKTKKVKNYTLLAIIIFFMLVFFATTIIKMS